MIDCFFRDFSKFREENQIIQIMKNCIYEVNRDIMLKNSKIKNLNRRTASRHQSAVDLRNTDLDNLENLPSLNNRLTMSEKYEVV